MLSPWRCQKSTCASVIIHLQPIKWMCWHTLIFFSSLSQTLASAFWLQLLTTTQMCIFKCLWFLEQVWKIKLFILLFSEVKILPIFSQNQWGYDPIYFWYFPLIRFEGIHLFITDFQTQRLMVSVRGMCHSGSRKALWGNYYWHNCKNKA